MKPCEILPDKHETFLIVVSMPFTQTESFLSVKKNEASDFLFTERLS